VRILWAISTAHRHYETNDLTSHLEARSSNRRGRDVGDKRVRRNHDMGTWN
jgi:hypothetical protein